jgi:hypothetical protein
VSSHLTLVNHIQYVTVDVSGQWCIYSMSQKCLMFIR